MIAIFISQRAYANFDRDCLLNALKQNSTNNALLPLNVPFQNKNGQYNKIGTSFVANIKILRRTTKRDQRFTKII